MEKKLFFVTKIVINIVFLLVISILFHETFKTYLMKGSIDQEIELLNKEVKKYDERKMTLQTNMNNFTEEEKIERIARDRLNMKKEGEVIYKIVE